MWGAIAVVAGIAAAFFAFAVFSSREESPLMSHEWREARRLQEQIDRLRRRGGL